VPTYAESMRNAYEKARLEASEISEREELAAYWLNKVSWFSHQLTRVCQIAADLEEMHIPVPLPLSQARRTLLYIVRVCQGLYELYS
jgi:hypothetical protein